MRLYQTWISSDDLFSMQEWYCFRHACSFLGMKEAWISIVVVSMAMRGSAEKAFMMYRMDEITG